MLPYAGHAGNEGYSTLSMSRGKASASTKGEIQREKQWCDHCNKLYHTRETCWKMHGKPASWKPRNQRKGGQSAYVAETEKSNSNMPIFTDD